MNKTVIAQGKVNKSKINIYGEIHTNIPDNSFYESLKLDDHLLLVEHTSLRCDIRPDESSLFENAKGSEWIFKNYHTKGNVVCVDTRVETGFLNAYEEKELNSLPIKEFLQKVTKVIKVAIVNKEMYSMIDDLFSEFIETIQKQILIFTYLSNTTKEIIIHSQVIEKDILLPNIKDLLIKNVVKLAGIYMDLYITNIVYSNESSNPISIFVGMNHAVRLARILKLKIKNDIKGFPIDPSWEPLGDPEIESDILSQLRNTSFGKNSFGRDLKYLLKIKDKR